MFIINNHNPSTRKDIIFNKLIFSIYKYFKDNNINNNIQNLIITGTTSSGKHTLVNYILQHVFGSSSTYDEKYVIKNYGSNTTNVIIKQSYNHMVINPMESALDKYIIQEVIRDFCKKKDRLFYNSNNPYKFIIINNFDCLLSSGQSALCKLVEQYSKFCRFIFIGRDINTLSYSISVKCVHLRLQCPTHSEIFNILDKHIKKYNMIAPPDVLNKISSKRNIKDAMWSLDCYQYKILEQSWQNQVNTIIEMCKNPSGLEHYITMRNLLASLFITNLKSQDLCVYILEKMLEFDNIDGYQVTDIILTYDYRLRNSTRYILHFEAMFNNLTALIKK
uniref:Uncharacterized protein n=1 Tax=Megaviridae environmental sample TaxID=1737588 RepID=A0A5J6VJZ9_9VIRU|nr:MAG: hypothetical protein [Megaviridae environmental sample]